MPASLDLSQPEKKLRKLALVLKDEANGKELRKDLTKQLRAAAGPARQAARQAIRSVASAGGHKGRSIRSAIAQKIQVVAKLSGKTVGARVVAKETSSTRGFTNAPRRFNSVRGWSHGVYGKARQVHQVGKPNWFDDTLMARKPEFKRSVENVMEETARRVGKRI
jgi:hypothetical protein